MEVRILKEAPIEWKYRQPLETYDTRFLYIGFSRYDTTKKTLSNFKVENQTILYSETPQEQHCLSRCYSTEHVRVTIYSKLPRVWKEEVGIEEVHFFLEKHPTQVA
jgi:hypothetical protein